MLHDSDSAVFSRLTASWGLAARLIPVRYRVSAFGRRRPNGPVTRFDHGPTQRGAPQRSRTRSRGLYRQGEPTVCTSQGRDIQLQGKGLCGEVEKAQMYQKN